MQRSRRSNEGQVRVRLLAFLALAIMAMPATVKAQRVDFTYRTFGLEIDSDNVIQNAGHLDPFLEKLHQLQVTGQGVVNIVHIGDSHIQADMMTSIIRRNLHRHFGNAGRGLVVPLRVARTNEPSNYRTASRSSWRSKRCVFPDQPLPIGIGGVTIETTKADANLEIAMNDLWLDYSFNAVTLFYEKDSRSFDFTIHDEAGKKLGAISGTDSDSLPYRTRVEWSHPVKAIDIRNRKKKDGQSRAIIYGAVLENSKSGVLYHTIGVNGARFKHYNAARRFAPHAAALKPDLFIISLGTNESIDYPNIDKTLPSQIDTFLSSLRAQCPDAVFILVTPQDVFRMKNKSNPGIREVRDNIIQYAVDNGLAFYDQYRAMGGDDSAQAWTENALLSPDGVHLTRDGYEYQGNLFYHALIKSYNFYVPDRHP